ncbi:MAG: aspartate aminotransferase family protein [Chloroflexi bacterium]|nr:MAG: aspartate aminotransferase family protein [Chloroflexota bacterium]MBL1193356.1 aspartate aminotransferase family protein [Chloroflexota bacterium]NOH10648.1 aspartate aminotransferase family protein [Chloroflexota bacterium]
MQELIQDAMQRVSNYLTEVQTRRVSPSPEALQALAELEFPMPDKGMAVAEVLRFLDEIGSPATVASAGGRYFGFVTGGSLPAALAAKQLASAWDQNTGLYVMSPIAAKLEMMANQWLVDLLELPASTAVGFVTGATMANFTGLAAARHAVLERAGWNAEKQGLFGAPEVKVVVGEEYHASMKKALNLIGFGSERVIKVPVDEQGRMRADALPEMDAMTVLCLQSGNVNSGAFDPAAEIIPAAQDAGAWVHVDAAFGLWARASDELKRLAIGLELADSISTDAHKWLNVPYDCGLVFVREPQHLVAAMTEQAAYLIESNTRDNMQFTPEMSRRGRGIEVWAALLSLGKEGLAELVERNCRQTRRFAEGLQAAGYEVLNDVVLNQVMVKFGDAEITNQVISAVQEEGTMWAGGTVWQGYTAMRISVSSWATTNEDIEASLAALLRVANELIEG